MCRSWPARVCAAGCGTDPNGNAITTFDGLISYNTRSSLVNGASYSATSDYRAKAYHDDMDVWSFDIGTTTSFTASDPVTQFLGADSSFLLTELGIVHIDMPATLENVWQKMKLMRGAA